MAPPQKCRTTFHGQAFLRFLAPCFFSHEKGSHHDENRYFRRRPDMKIELVFSST